MLVYKMVFSWLLSSSPFYSLINLPLDCKILIKLSSLLTPYSCSIFSLWYWCYCSIFMCYSFSWNYLNNSQIIFVITMVLFFQLILTTMLDILFLGFYDNFFLSFLAATWKLHRLLRINLSGGNSLSLSLSLAGHAHPLTCIQKHSLELLFLMKIES